MPSSTWRTPRCISRSLASVVYAVCALVIFCYIVCSCSTFLIMPGKRPSTPSTTSAGGEKKQRKAISLEEKLCIIAKREAGMPMVAIARETGLAASTISTIFRDKERITEAVKSVASTKSTIITAKRTGPIEEMEKLLVVWIEDQIQKRIPLTKLNIQAKARSIFQTLKAQQCDPKYTQGFTASQGWFERFKKRHGFHKVKIDGSWVFHSENIRSFKEISKHMLPMHYRHNPKDWMRLQIFEDWFLNFFNPAAEKYCREKNIPFKILLILDNALGHPAHLGELHPDVKVVMSPNTTVLFQPINQGAIAAFKAYYLRRMFSQAVAATDRDVTSGDFWRGYDILDAIKNILSAWEYVRISCMNGVWSKVLNVFVNDFRGFDKDSEVKDIGLKIVQLGKQLELDVETDDIVELVDAKGGELSNEDLIELEEKQNKAEGKKDEPEEEPRKFTLKAMAEAFSMISSAMQIFEKQDCNFERFLKVDWQVQDAIACYREIFKEMKKQKVDVTAVTTSGDNWV